MVSATAQLDRPAAFRTVLAVSNNPDDYRNQGVDPDDEVKYIGPMYFDLDGEDIGKVLESAKELIGELKDKWDLKNEHLQCWLSGKKGVHITFSEKLMGLNGPIQLLPLIYGKFASQFHQDHIDRNVYSMGKGRMWRCPGVKRPDSGTFKVQVTAEELLNLTEEKYHSLVSEPRGELGYTEPTEALPKLDSFLKSARGMVRKERAAAKRAQVVVTNDDLRAVTGVPGCIEILITEGDCPESNWNQASIQLATYIAARYDQSEEAEYTPLLVDPFLENVASGSRPSVAERRSSLNDQLHRAYQGQVKFGPGAIIATIGKPCGECIICNKKEQVNKTTEGEYLDKLTNIKFGKDGVFMVNDNGAKQLITAGMVPVKSFDMEFEMPGGDSQRRHESYLCQVGGHLVDLTQDALTDKRQMVNALKGTNVFFYGGDSDAQKIGEAMARYIGEFDIIPQIRSPQAGIVFQQKDGGIVPHLVTRNHSYTKNNGYSEYVYSGNHNHAPDFTHVEALKGAEGEQLYTTVSALMNMNDKDIIIPALAWFISTHLKTHLVKELTAFPMLNLCGSSHSGKSGTLFLLQTLNAFPYRQAPVWNAEVDTIYPLEDMVGSSTTIVRIIEEANESTAKRKWPQLVGILKASWDAQGITKGVLSNRRVEVKTIKNDAPIVYLSEQSFPVQSVRTRSIVCHLSPANLEKEEYTNNHRLAVRNVEILERFAKNLSAEALNLNPTQLRRWIEEAEADLPEAYNGRTAITYTCLLVGLKFLQEICVKFSQALADEIYNNYHWFIQYLGAEEDTVTREKKHSATDDIFQHLGTMASEEEHPAHGLVCGVHYWADQGYLYMDIAQCFPRYRRFIRGIGLDSLDSITNSMQWTELLVRESYYHGTITHPHKPGSIIQILNMSKMAEKGIPLQYFRQGKPEP